MTLRNFKFFTIPTSVPLTSPVTVDGTITRKEDITILNVHVDGRRAQQSNLASNEDGGRDGFRIVGKAKNIFISQSSAVNCGTDGLKIFSADVKSGDDRVLNFENIWVIDSRFEKNRRHGVSLDSLRDVHFVNSTFNNNGVASGNNATEGEKAYLFQNRLYGAGLVVEGYGSGTGVTGLTIVNSTATGNARFGIQFWNPTSPAAVGFQPWQNIRIEGSTMDGGVSPEHGRQALEFSAPDGFFALGRSFSDVTLSNNTILGTLIVKTAINVKIFGGTAISPYVGFYGGAISCKDVYVQGVISSNKAFVIQ
ncbi:hypothetical protein [Bryobacter aggregatus]|uniref:hypothetical protein n=1 Tax=Bryobacter aggregatus TaxID=360054 RepID=UPI0012BB0543|nr:hypothetical protein [Bryobacter aggregatus]